MKEKRNVHLKVQELCDCYATNDPLKEMSTIKNDGDKDEAALKWLALAALHGVNDNADEVTITGLHHGREDCFQCPNTPHEIDLEDTSILGQILGIGVYPDSGAVDTRGQWAGRGQNIGEGGRVVRSGDIVDVVVVFVVGDRGRTAGDAGDMPARGQEPMSHGQADPVRIADQEGSLHGGIPSGSRGLVAPGQK